MLTRLTLAAVLTTGCTTDNGLAEGEQAWTFELRTVATDAPRPLPACSLVEDGFELRMLRGEQGQLLGIYTPGTNQRFDEYRLATDEQAGVVTLDMTRELPGGVAEQWSFELFVGADSRRYVGAATQMLTAGGAASCETIYLADVHVDD